MDEDNIINKGRPVYISFSENDKGKVDKLVSALQNAGIEFSYMYHNLPGAEKIAYEREIGFGEFVILVFGKDYFESWDCMYEFARVNKFKELNSQKMVICLPFEGYKDIMNSDNGWQPIKDMWDHRKSEGEENNGVKSLAKYYNYYGKEILRLPDYYKNIVRPERKDEDYQKLITQVKDFFRNHPTPITNSSEIFYKFDKDMWKNFVLRYTEPDGSKKYFIPDISRGLENDDDKQQFKAMIEELLENQIISQCDDDTELELSRKTEYQLRLKKNNSLCIFMDPMGSDRIDCYPLLSTQKQVFKEWDGKKNYFDLSLPYAKVFNNFLNGKGKVNII